jgi:hypothetical protein
VLGPIRTYSLSAKRTLNFKDGEFAWSRKIQGFVLGSYFYGYLITEVCGLYAATAFSGLFAISLSKDTRWLAFVEVRRQEYFTCRNSGRIDWHAPFANCGTTSLWLAYSSAILDWISSRELEHITFLLKFGYLKVFIK